MARVEESDLDVCAREPIRVPGAIQPHGALLVLEADGLRVRQASRNASAFLSQQVVVGETIEGPLAPLASELRLWLREDDAFFEREIERGDRLLHAVAHRAGNAVVLEFEDVPPGRERFMERLFPRIRAFADSVSAGGGISELAGLTARFVCELTGFDRALVYRFDEEWNGRVVGEDGNGALPSYLDLRFPAGDIPAQARELYRLNRIRIIPDVDYEPCPIEPRDDPATGEPLDLSFATLRSVSPVHLEYMRNMGTASSMSVSIVVEGALWGLVSCHSRAPHNVSINIRNACDYAIQSLATEIAARRRAEEAAQRLRLGEVRARLISAMAAASDWRDALIASKDDLLAQVDATGAVIIDGADFHSVGDTPSLDEVRDIVAFLEKRNVSEIYHTDNLRTEMPDATDLAENASGLMAIRFSELHPSWLLWFRPEVVRTVEWGGDPHKSVREKGRIHPRVSFETWREQVHGHSAAWRRQEADAAQNLRSEIVGIVLRRAEEMAQLTEELQRSNKELEAFSYSVSHDLRAPFRHIVGFTQLLREREDSLDDKSKHYLDSISESAVAAGRLVDDLLNFSQIGRARLVLKPVDNNKIVAEVRRSLELGLRSRNVEWDIADLPQSMGDATLLRQVWYNLVENAVKYTRPRDPARVAIRGWEQDNWAVFSVEDNGVGFDMAYTEKLFGVFQRLQREEDFEGTGIGLALARRIVERHGGAIDAEGELDNGSRFTFRLPGRNAGSDNG